MDMIKKIEFYEQKLKEAKSEFYKFQHDDKRESVKIIAQRITDQWSMYHGDCVEVMQGLPSDKIHYSIFSPIYSSNPLP